MAQNMGRYVGSVKSFNATKGWGFIECAETQQIYGKDILFQKSELPCPVEKGNQLSFSVTQGRNGVLAVGLQLLGQESSQPAEWSEAVDATDSSFGNYMGTIKSYSAQKGWGFVECAETQQIYGKDILVLKDELRGISPTPGQRVAFSVSQGRKGPLATSVRLLPAAIGAIGALPAAPAANDWGAAQARSGFGLKRKIKESEGPKGPSYFGTIKSFSLARGWGFVECPETEAIYGKDILVLKDELAGASVDRGQRVYFTVTQGRNGPLATDIQLLVPAGAAAQMRSQGMFNLRAAAPTIGAITNGDGGRQPKRARASEHGEVLCGSIKSFDEEKGWGFVTGEAILKLYGKDVFISKAALHGQAVSQGDQVMFTVEMGMKGPMAGSVTVLPGGTLVVEGTPGNVFTGTIKSFNVEKGWGFITSEETTNLFGKDLFLHKRELGSLDPPPNAGDQVQFSVQLSDKGRPEAARVFPLMAHENVYVQASYGVRPTKAL